LEDALRVPSSAVLSQEGKSFVFVQKELGEYERRAVVIGFSNDGEVEVREGLKPDELVVVAGAFALKSEMMRSKLAEGGHHH
jgi:cobalt-zinc-cadmium efflux system membrane fusion protein